MPHVEEHLLAYLDGELSPAEIQSVEAHLARCPACRAQLEELQTLQAGLARTLAAAYAATQLSPAAEQRIRRALAAERERPAHSWWQALQAGLLGLARPLGQVAIPLVALFFVVVTFNAARLPGQAGAQELLVLGQDTFAPGSTAAVRVVVRDNVSGQPVANAHVGVSLRQAGLARTVFVGNTDETGSAPVQFQVPEAWEGEAELVVEADSALGEDAVSAPIRLERTYRLLLSSDRPVYRPGETVHLRTLALATVDSRPAAAARVRFEAFDPRGNPLLSQEVLTSDFGIAAADLPLGVDAAEGAYRLRVTLGDTVSERTVQVSQAELPAFRVDVRADAPYYLPGQAIAGAVEAAYFFGRPVSDAQVVLRSVVSRQRPTADAADPTVWVQEVRGRTDAAGRFAFQVALPAFPDALFSSGQPGRPETTLALDLEATVTDAAGQSEFGWQKLTVARQPLLVDAVAEGGTLRTGVENVLYVLASYPDGQPAVATLQVQIGEAAPMAAVTSAAGIAEVRYTPRPGDGGSRTVRILAADPAGRQGRADLVLPLDQAREALLLRTDRALYQVGDTVAAEVLATVAADAVFLDVVKGGQLVLTLSAPVRDGKATFALDLTPELAGTLELNAYAVGSDSNALRDARVIVVDAPEALQVELATDRPEYRPGEEATLSAQVRAAADGSPTQAALGLAVVNEAVFARRDYQPGFARAYFLLDDTLRAAGAEAPADLAEARQQIARAVWASYAGQPYTLAVQSVDTETPAEVNRARTAAFQRIGLGLSAALTAAAAILAVLVLVDLRRRGVLGGAVGRGLATLLLAGGVSVGAAALLTRLTGVQAWLALAVVGGLWWLALAALAVYAWRWQDGRTQYAVLLALAYAVGLGLLSYAAGQGAALPRGWVVVLGGGLAVVVVSWLLLGWGLRLDGQRKVGLAGVAVGLLWLPLVFALSAVQPTSSRLLERIAAPVARAMPGSWLAGCAGPARSPDVGQMAVEAPGEQAPEAAPAAAPAVQTAEETPQATEEPLMAAAVAPEEPTLPAPGLEAATEEPLQATSPLTVTAAVSSAEVVTATEVLTDTFLAVAPAPTEAAAAEADATPQPTEERSLAHAAVADTPTPTPPPPAEVSTATVEPTPSVAPVSPTPTPMPPVTPPTPVAEPALPAPLIGLQAFGFGRSAEPKARPDDLARLPIVRERFPQTLYWNPQVVTDADGRVQVSIPVGDTITTWRVTALAVDRSGRLGSATAALAVFQPFFVVVSLPTSPLAVGQEAIAGVQIFNYSGEPLLVSLSAQPAAGLAVRLVADRVSVPANEVALVPMALRGLAPGEHTLVVVAQANGVEDARQGVVKVVP